MNKLTISEIKKELNERGVKNITKEDIYYWGIIISIERSGLNNIKNKQ
ncbi:MAG: hypothetical protein PF542_01860 [Nanoarchaeota archaeon]|jgi:hypothetical protein|nr:hypothetical protein [Nanoarchaeota archaeon]